MTLPSSPPPSSWTDEHALPTEPMASSELDPEALDLTRTHNVLALIREAERHTAAGLHGSARGYARQAVLSLASILGVGWRHQDLLEAMLAKPLPLSDYEIGHLDGRICTEARP